MPENQSRENKYWIHAGVQCQHATGRGPVMTVMNIDQVIHKHRKTKKNITIVGGVKCRWVEDGIEKTGTFHTKELKPYYLEK